MSLFTGEQPTTQTRLKKTLKSKERQREQEYMFFVFSKHEQIQKVRAKNMCLLKP